MKPILVILGPTATGKSSLAMKLARLLGGEIVNADALQVYRGLSIGTAKPSPEEMEEIPHHLVDILDPAERFSAGDFARRAREAISDIESRGKKALVVGGSGLYLRSLLEGMSPIPRGDEALRRELDRRTESEGLGKLHEELRGIDPETAGRLAPGDRQRILRALEVAYASGRPLSGWIAEQPFGRDRIPALRIGLTLPRAILYDRISERVHLMIERGWIGEVSAMLELGVEPDVPAFQAIGYRQLVRHLSGEWELDEAVDDIVRATRRYAKRQLTWFRKETDIRWIPALSVDDTIPSLLNDFKMLEESSSHEQA